MDVQEIEKMKYNDIKKMAKDMNLDTSGSKQDIVERICNANQEQSKDDQQQDDVDQEQNEDVQQQDDVDQEQNENDQQQDDVDQEQKEEVKEERVAMDGVLKVIFNGQVRLRRTAEFTDSNIIRLEPNGSIFRVVAVVKNKNSECFYELSNGAFVAKDDKLVEFKLG